MKSDKLKLYIRQIVREEVAMAIGEVITEMKQPTHEKKSQVQSRKRKKVVREKKHFSDNSILNDVLNETAETALFDDSDSNPLNEMHDVMKSSYGDMMNSDVNVEEATAMGVTPDKLNSGMDLLTKDYSAILKKSYEKSGKK